jgi:methyl-accepting chemotaxis protein
MANSLLKLTVDSSEYDAKLKKAAEGIRHLADRAHESAGELTGLEKSELDFIKALGEMETKSRSAAGQVRELESTYKELKVIYDQLNDVEKADEGGKALAASLEQIKQRAQDARAQLDNASKSLQDNANAGKESSSMLDALASKFTINIDALKLFDLGIKAQRPLSTLPRMPSLHQKPMSMNGVVLWMPARVCMKDS